MKTFRIPVFLLLAFAAMSCEQPAESRTAISPSIGEKDFGTALILAESLAGGASPDDHFFFLPPLAPKQEYEGTFAAELEPVVRVGVYDGAELVPLVEFSAGGKGSERVRTDFTEELGDFYIVNLHLNRFEIPVYSCLLIEVFIDGERLGALPAVTVPNGSEKEFAENGVALVMNRTVPIKFRIEQEYFEQIKQGVIEIWNPVGAAAELMEVPPYDDFIAVAAGTYHATGLRADGTLVSWGRDTSGQISDTPAGGGFVAVDAGLLYTMALHADGSVVAWGGGLAATENVPTGSGFKAIGAGFNFAYGITEAGELYQWGTMTGMPAGSDFVKVRASQMMAAALDGAGTLLLFGNNTSVVNAAIPAGIFVTMDTGDYHAAGILSDGRLVSWGGTSAAAYGLVQDFTDGPYIAVAAGERIGLGLRKDGTLRAYGNHAMVPDIPSDVDGYIAIAVSPVDTVIAIRRVTSE